MKAACLGALILLMASMSALAQDPGMRDSVIVGSVRVDSGATFAFVPIYAVTDDSVMFYNLPLRWNAPLGGVYPGQRTLYFSPITSWDEQYDTVFVSRNYIRQLAWNCIYVDTFPNIPLWTNGQRHHFLTLRFVIDPGARPQIVTIDSCYDWPNGSIQFYLNDGIREFCPAFQLGSITIGPAVGIDEVDPSLPDQMMLSQNYPNPFNARTTISYSLPEPGHVTLSIYNLLGQKVATLVDGVEQAGEHRVVWEAGDVPSGVYFGRLVAGESRETIKMVVMK